VAETAVKRHLCCGFQNTGKAMGQVSMLVEDILRNKCFFQVRISRVLHFISICDLFTDSPSYFSECLMLQDMLIMLQVLVRLYIP
jgi:hypothetical protein